MWGVLNFRNSAFSRIVKQYDERNFDGRKIEKQHLGCYDKFFPVIFTKRDDKKQVQVHVFRKVHSGSVGVFTYWIEITMNTPVFITIETYKNNKSCSVD